MNSNEESNFATMEEWELDFEWLKVRHFIKSQFDKESLPDLNAVLYLIGMRELGEVRSFTKEEKQDLMHVAVCRLLADDGYYILEGRDDDGWPHYAIERQLEKMDRITQEKMLKEKIIDYFKKEVEIQ